MNTVVSVNVGLPKRFARERRRLVCRESSILSGDGGSVMTVCPSRPEARRRFGSETANELGAPVASSIPEQLPGREPASTRKGYEDGNAVFRKQNAPSLNERLSPVLRAASACCRNGTSPTSTPG